jgi:hypothetical protein
MGAPDPQGQLCALDYRTYRRNPTHSHKVYKFYRL